MCKCMRISYISKKIKTAYQQCNLQTSYFRNIFLNVLHGCRDDIYEGVIRNKSFILYLFPSYILFARARWIVAIFQQ